MTHRNLLCLAALGTQQLCKEALASWCHTGDVWSMALLLKISPCHQSEITEHNDKVSKEGKNSLLVFQQMREWQANALKNHCLPEAQGIRTFKGKNGGGWRPWCSQIHKVATCKYLSRHSCMDLIAFCFFYGLLLSPRDRVVWAPNISFLPYL